MGVSSLVIIVFIAASMGLSWISGDKEQERLYDRIAKRGVETQDVEKELGDKNRQFKRQSKELQKIKSKLRVELRAKKKIERKLSYEVRQRRLADEQRNGVDDKKKTKDPTSSPVTTIDKEAVHESAQSAAERANLEKASAGAEIKVKLEIAELERKLRAVEEHSKMLEAEMQLRVEEEAKKRSEAAWDQAKIAKVKAEQAVAESLQLKSRLDRIKKAKEAVDLALSEQEDALIRAEERLAKERMEREKLEEKLNNATNALDTSKAEGIEKREDASIALRAAEKAVGIARMPQEVASSAKAISRLNTVRVEAQKGLNAKSQEVLLLKFRIKEIESEKEIISNEALGNSNRLIALKQQLEMVKLKESDLRDTLKEQKVVFAAELASALGAQKLSLKKVYDVKLAKLESRFADAGIATVETGKVVDSETVRLRARTLELEEQNQNLNNMLRESKIALAEASAEREIAKELIAKNVALEARLKEAGLANLQGKASDYVAQKLIERNAGLEQQLQVARLGLAKSEAARVRAAELSAENSTLVSKLKNADVSLAATAYNGSSDIVKQITSRNAELEVKIIEAESALAQAEAARFMVKELNSKNIELNEMLARERAAGSDGSEIEVKLRNINSTLELKLKEERGVRGSIEAKLVEAIAAKSAGEVAIEDLVKLRSNAQNSLRQEVEAKKSLEVLLAKTKSKLSMSELSVEEAVQSKNDAEELLLKLRTPGFSGGPVMTGSSNVEVAGALDIANFNRKELESKLQSQTEAGRIVEAKLRIFEETVGKQRETIESLEKAVADAEARLESKLNAIDKINAEIDSVSAKAKSVGTEAGSDITLLALQSEFTNLKSRIEKMLKSGEIEAVDLAKIMKTNDVLDIHIISKGETLWSVASKKEHYANPYMWPLLYRYNISDIKNMSNLLPGQVLIIFKEVPKAEAGDAIKKARYRGDWNKWSAEQQKNWVSGRARH